MGSNFFISKDLRKKIEKDIKKRDIIEDKLSKLQEDLSRNNIRAEKDLDEFYDQIDDCTVLSTIRYYEVQVSDKQKNVIRELEERFKNRKLFLDDTLKLMDWYEKMCNDYNDKI